MTTAARTWTVTTWNLRGSAKPDLTAIAATISSEAPDVVVLQEVRRHQAEELADLLGMRWTWALKHYPFTPLYRRGAEGMAILSAHDIDEVGHRQISTGTSTWFYKRRIVQWCLVSRADHSAYRIYNLHLSSDSAADRLTQAGVITDIVAGHGDAPPTILAGDLNDVTGPSDKPDGDLLGRLPGLEHLRPSPTNPATEPTQVLDHVLLPIDATAVAVTVPAGGATWAALSDHLPVTVRFDLDWVQGDFT